LILGFLSELIVTVQMPYLGSFHSSTETCSSQFSVWGGVGWVVFKSELPSPCFPSHAVSTTTHLLTSENNKANKSLNILTRNSTATLTDAVKLNILYCTNKCKWGRAVNAEELKYT